MSRRLSWTVLTAVFLCAFAGWGAAQEAEKRGSMYEEDKKAIEEVINQYLSGWRKLDAQTLKGIWDQGHAQLTYKPAELEQPLTDWQGIEKYYDEVTKSMEIREFRVSDPVIDIFGDVAYVSPKTFFSAVMKDSGEKIEAEGRVSFILHKKGGKWLVTNYLEPAS